MSRSSDDALAARRETARRFVVSAQAGDYETMKSCLTEDFFQAYPRPGAPGGPEGAHGRDTFADFLRDLSIYAKGPRQIDIEAVMAEGDLAAIHYKMTAVTAAGEPYANWYCQILQFSGDRIAKAWEYCDTLYGAKMLRPDLLDAPE